MVHRVNLRCITKKNMMRDELKRRKLNQRNYSFTEMSLASNDYSDL